MVIGKYMTTKNYLMIQENVVMNIVVWDGNTQNWQPQQDVIMFAQVETPTKVWALNSEKTEYVLTNSIGDANLGFTWDGTFATTNLPKPEVSVTSPQE